MRKKTVFAVLLCFALLAPVAQGLAKIPPDLYKELQTNRKEAIRQPNNPQAWYEYAMSCAYTGWVEDGLEALKKVDKLDPNYAKKMTPVYKDKVDANPSSWKDRFYYAFSVYALTINRKNKSVSRAEAKVHQEEAFKQFKQVAELLGDKNFVTAWAYGYMGAIRGEQEKYDDAIKYLRRGLKIEPDGVALHMALGYAYMKTGNFIGFLGETLTVNKLKSEEERYYGKNKGGSPANEQ